MSEVRTIEKLGMPLLDTAGAIIRSKNFYARYPFFINRTKENILISNHKLTVLGIAGVFERSNGKNKLENTLAVLAQCECGEKTVIALKDLIANKVKSCGCIKKEINIIQGELNGYRKKYLNSEMDAAKRALVMEEERILNNKAFESNSNLPIPLIRKRFYEYQISAFRHKRDFELNREELTKIVTAPCHYCGEIGDKPNGIDRIDNEIGYILTNVVSCCKDCNYMKSVHEQSYFLNHIKKIAKHNNF